MRIRARWLGAAGVALVLGLGVGSRLAALEPDEQPAAGQAPLSGGDFQVASGPIEVEPRVYVDPGGRVYRLWIERTGKPDEGGILHITWSDDGGSTWLPAPATPPDRKFKDLGGFVSGPRLAFGPDRAVYAVWRSKYRTPKTRLTNFQVSSDGGATWAPDSRTLNQGETTFNPQIAQGPDGLLVVTWSDERGGGRPKPFDVFVTRSRDGGKTWSDEVKVSPTEEDGIGGPINVRPQVVVGPHGLVYLGWTSVLARGGSTILFRRSLDAGVTWEPTIDVGRGGSSTETPIILSGGGDQVTLIWASTRRVESGPGTGPGIWVSRSDSAGARWTEPVRVDHAYRKPGAMVGLASAARGPAGEIYVAWQDSRNSRDDIYLNRSLDGGATWLPEDLRVDQDDPGTAFSRSPKLAVSPMGTIAVGWADDRAGFAGVYLAVSRDRGATWEETRVDQSPPPRADARDVEMAWGPGEALHVVWRAERHLSVNDATSTVHYRRLTTR